MAIEQMRTKIRELSSRLDLIQRKVRDPRNRVVIQTHDAAICVGAEPMWRIMRAPSCTCNHRIVWFFFWKFRLGVKY